MFSLVTLGWIQAKHYSSIVFRYFNDQNTNYLNRVLVFFDVVTEGNFQLKGSFHKIKCPLRKTNGRQFNLPYMT